MESGLLIRGGESPEKIGDPVKDGKLKGELIGSLTSKVPCYEGIGSPPKRWLKGRRAFEGSYYVNLDRGTKKREKKPEGLLGENTPVHPPRNSRTSRRRQTQGMSFFPSFARLSNPFFMDGRSEGGRR